MRKSILILMIILPQIIFSQTTISDGQKVTGKWTKAKSPYIIEGEAIVPSSSTLTIEPGVEVKFKTGENNIYTMRSFDLAYLKVEGTLIAEGTSSEKILFTRNSLSGSWGIVLFASTSVNSSMKFCKIEYAGSIVNAIDMVNFYGAVSFYKSSGTIENCEIVDNSVSGISCINSASPNITNTVICDNLNIGIYCYNSSSPTITNCTIANNGWQGIYVINNSSPEIKNSIFWQNSKDNNFGESKISYSLIEESSLTSTAYDKGNNIYNTNPIFTNINTGDYSLQSSSPCIASGYASQNIGANISTVIDVSNNETDNKTLFIGDEAYKVYYKEEIQTELDASGLFAEKGEFETTKVYEERLQKAEEFKTEIFNKYKLQYQELSKNQANAEEKELISKIKESYTEFEIKQFDIATYDADNQTFLITLRFTAPNSNETKMMSENILVPIDDAPSFKQNAKNVKITGAEQLLEDGKTWEVFNIQVVHPTNFNSYAYGVQKVPLYLDVNENYDVIVEDNELDGIPFLISEIRFEDPSGNNLLDANEYANLVLTIKNEGDGSALDLNISITCDNELGFSFDKNLNIPKIKAGETETTYINLRADQTLVNGEITFEINFAEQRGFPPAPIKITIGTQELKTPKLQFVETGITEENGDGDNIIENGELIYATVLIQNIGQGVAENISTSILIGDDNIIPVKTSAYPLYQEIEKLEPGEAKKINFYFSVNWIYEGSDELPMDIKITEKEEIYGGSFSLGLNMSSQSLATNDVKVEGVYSDDIQIEDVSLSVDVDVNIPETNKTNENRYALIIGNENYSEYQTGLTATADVEFAIHDAQVFKLYATKTLGVPKENIIELYDGQRYEMERDIAAFVKLAEFSNGKAELFVYYAGHGFPDDETKDAYIMPVDISGADVTNGIKLADFYQKLTQFPTEKVTVFIDACFSGGGRNEGLVAARSGVRIKPNTSSLSGKLVVFAASSGEQISLPYKEKQHGLFTYFLLKGFQDNSGDLTYGELADYILEKVQIYSLTVNKQEQNPKVNVSEEISNEWENWKFNN